jgi:hypothetical protein
MSKRISQSTFDEVVNENVDDFDMTLNDAIKDAINQFKSQGVDLINIDITGGIGREECLACISDVVNMANKVTLNDNDIIILNNSLKLLNDYCSDKCQYMSRNHYLMIPNGCINALHTLLIPEQNKSILILVFQAMIAMSKSNIENRDFFEPGGSKRLCDILEFYLNENENLKEDNSCKLEEVLKWAFNLGKCVAKSENNKTKLMHCGMGEIIVTILSHPRTSSISTGDDDWAPVVEAACLLMRGLCVHDDLRNEMSSAHDNGRFFINAPTAVPALMRLSSEFENHPTIASAALAAARNLITTEEAVKVMTNHGAMKLPLAILNLKDASVSLVRSLFGVMRNLCADDARKTKLATDGSLQLMLHTMSSKKFNGDSLLMEHGIACCAAMSLRSPSNSTRIVEYGGPELIIKTMHAFIDKGALLRQGALCIRNIAGRCPEFVKVLLDAGAEAVLRLAGRHQDCVDEAYAALRDLGCEVQYVKITENGNVESVFEHFGEKQKLNFNPVWDDRDDFTQRMQEEAKAPFENLGAHDHIHSHEHDEHCNH